MLRDQLAILFFIILAYKINSILEENDKCSPWNMIYLL